MGLPGTVTRILLSLCLSLAIAGTALAQGLSNLNVVERRAIRSVIEAQINAFRADDGERAFGFAAPSIRGIFRTADNFMAMVRRGFEPVYRPRDVRFGDLVDVEQTLVQKVFVTAPDGKQVLALYSMERQSDGSWRISGCMLAEPDDEV
jgi:hypothetical protein